MRQNSQTCPHDCLTCFVSLHMNKVLIITCGFWRVSSVHFSSPYTNRNSEAIETEYHDIYAERVRNKSMKRNSGIQLGFKASETDRQCHQKIIEDLVNKKGGINNIAWAYVVHTSAWPQATPDDQHMVPPNVHCANVTDHLGTNRLDNDCIDTKNIDTDDHCQ